MYLPIKKYALSIYSGRENTKNHLLPSRLYCRYRNYTVSTLSRSRTVTAGGEFHPALKICCSVTYTITDRPIVVKWKILWYYQVEDASFGILKPRMTPFAAVSVMSPPMTWFLLMSTVA